MKQEVINIIVLGVAIVLLLLVAIALVHLIFILSHTTILLQAIILLNETHLTMIIRLASDLDLLLVLTNAIYKTMSTIDLEAKEASVMADQRMKDMSVVHLDLPMAMELRCIELQLMNPIEIRTPKTMLMHRMVVI